MALEMKSILKRKTSKPTSQLKLEGATQSSSIGALRWKVPEESATAHSSAPTSVVRTSSPASHSQTGLKDLRSLQECVQFINHWKEQVDHVCKKGIVYFDHEEATCSKQEPQSRDRRAERSLEESRKLILHWASELDHVDKRLHNRAWVTEAHEPEDKHNKELDAGERTQQRIMDWARELQTASENCGVESEELGKVLRLLGLKKKKLVHLLPLLEFITWSLLKEDSVKIIPQLWLLAKQRTWQAGTPKYLPSSVWSWICSAAADVTLDPMTSHTWLQLSDDHRKVQEAFAEAELPYSPQRFDSRPCVLGWEGYSRGRHYWEVRVANNGYWRLGLTTSDSDRKGRFPMTPKHGYWTLWRSTHNFYACAKPEVPLPLSLVPRHVGIYLDYEEGQISFYNAENKSHIYTFTGNFRGKLYPLFAPLDGRTLMTIVPPDEISEN